MRQRPPRSVGLFHSWAAIWVIAVSVAKKSHTSAFSSNSIRSGEGNLTRRVEATRPRPGHTQPAHAAPNNVG